MKEKVWIWLAWHLPRELVKWAAVRLLANATVGPYGNQVVPELTAIDALKRWDSPNVPMAAVPAPGSPEETLQSQIDRLARHIMANIPGEPSRDEGAVDCAIRLLSPERFA